MAIVMPLPVDTVFHTLQVMGAMIAERGCAASAERLHRRARVAGTAFAGHHQVHGRRGVAWTLVGLISLLDPPRTDSAETIKRALELGVQVR